MSANLNAQPVLVTGAAGFIAYHLIEALLRSGRSVAGIDNFDSFYDRSLKEKNVSDLQKNRGRDITRDLNSWKWIFGVSISVFSPESNSTRSFIFGESRGQAVAPGARRVRER